MGFINSIGIGIDRSGSRNVTQPIVITDYFNSMVPSDLIMFGDSITNGQLYQTYLRNYFAGSLTNYATGQRGVMDMVTDANANMTVNNTSVVTAMSGFNDYVRSGANVKTDNKVVGAYRTLLVNCFAKTFIHGYSGSGLTLSGIAATWQPNLFGGKYANTGRSTTTNSYWSLAFTGTNISICFSGSNGTLTFGIAKIEIDGNLVINLNLNDKTDGISDTVINNQITPYTYCIFGLEDTAHTLKVTNTNGQIIGIDYFAILNDPGITQLVCLAEIPYMNATGFALGLATEAIFDNGSSLIQGVVNEFASVGYNVKYVPTNDFYDVININPDNVHPNATGQGQIYDAFLSVIKTLEFTLIANAGDYTIELTYLQDIYSILESIYNFEVSGKTVSSVSLSTDKRTITITLNELISPIDFLTITYSGNIATSTGVAIPSLFNRPIENLASVDLDISVAAGKFSKSGAEYTALVSAWNSYAISTIPLVGDGLVYVTLKNLSYYTMIGLRADAIDGTSNGVNYWPYRAFLNADNHYFYNYNNGSNVSLSTLGNLNDKMGFRRVSGVITLEIYRNGAWMVIYTFATPTSADLYFHISAYDTGFIVYDPKIIDI